MAGDPITWRDFERLLERVTYKPGWVIAASRDIFAPDADPWGSHPEAPMGMARVELTAEDSTGVVPGRNRIAHQHPVPARALYSLEHAIGWLLELVRMVEAHEAAEWLKVDGVAPFFPHGPRVPYLGPHRPELGEVDLDRPPPPPAWRPPWEALGWPDERLR